MTASLENRIAIVTGGGRGIGQAIAVELARAGATVAVVARSRDELDATATRVREAGGTALVVVADLGDRQQLDRCVREVRDGLGSVDILINNAAVITPLGPSVNVDIDDWAAAMRINVVAVAALSFAFLPDMLERRWGRIVNITSGVVTNATMTGVNAYTASKAAMHAHTLNLAAEMAGTGVTVNAYLPGEVDTEMQASVRRDAPEKIGTELHDRFERLQRDGMLISPEMSARSLVARLRGEDNGQVWDVSDPI